jgi:SNF2 family DNA or RNA helicase
MKLNQVLRSDLITSDVTLRLTPRRDQIEALASVLKTSVAGEFSQVGTGKSLVSYLYIMAKLYSGKGVIVVMPPSLIGQYVREMGVVEGHPFTIESFNKPKKQRDQDVARWEASEWPDVLCMSYEIFKKYYRKLASVRSYKCLVLDEAHAVSNPGTASFTAVFYLTFRCKMDALLMTATPMTTEVRSAYGLIKLKTPGAYSSLDQFDRMHVIFKTVEVNDRKIKTVAGYKNLEKVNETLMQYSVRRFQKDVLKLAGLNIFNREIPLEDEHRSIYRKLMEERILELGEEIRVARNAQALRQMALQIITNKEKYTNEDFPDSPLDNLVELVKSIDLSSTKLIVFCHFKDTVIKLNKVFSTYNPALIYGDSDTGKNADKFLNEDECRIAIVNFRAGGAGFNFQSVSHSVVVYESVGSPALIEQAIGRVHRGGQTEPVKVWVFNYALTLSGKLLNKAYERASDIKDVLGDASDLTDFIVDVEELLDSLGLSG